MSHFSRFDFKFKDKHILYIAMQNLGMSPENKIWNLYKNKYGKLLGVNGTPIGKLLSGSLENINVFFVENDGLLSPYVESNLVKGSNLETRGSMIISLIQREYVKCSLESLQNILLLKGESTSLHLQQNALDCVFRLEMANTGRKLTVILDNEGKVYEEVSGFKGSSCVDFTRMIENLITTDIERHWKPEYSEVTDEKNVQVLRLE